MTDAARKKAADVMTSPVALPEMAERTSCRCRNVERPNHGSSASVG